MEEERRKTGIDVLGDVPWGTHFCQFYQTREDLLDILLPYFKKGLEENEFCMWVTSEPLDEKEAEEAIRKALPHFDEFLKKGQIEIIPFSEWYVKDGAFNAKRVLEGWADKLKLALSRGFDGMRLTGNTFWLEKKDWKSFTDYEKEVNSVIGTCKMIAVCTYSLDRCGAFELIDVMRNHQFALIRREAKWELVESSERKKAKDEVARSEAKYRSLVENTGQGVATTDLKGRFTYVNETLCKMIGYDEKELLGKNFADFLHPDEKKRILNLFWEVLKTLRRKRLHLEFRVIHKKGHVLHWYSSPTAFRHKGRILGFSAIITDITDRKKIEKVLKNAAREWYATFDAISDAVLVTDLEGKVLRCNKAMADLMRRPFHEIVGDTCWEVLYGAPGPLEGSPVSLMKKSRSRQRAFLQKGERYFQIDVDPLLDETGDLIGAVRIMTDITDRKRAERRIQEQNEFLNSVLESFAHPLYVVDVNDYTVKMANSAAGLGKISKDSTCYAAHYKRNRPCEGTEHPCPIEKVRRTKQPVVVEHLHYDKDGSPRHTEVHTYPIFDDEGNLSQVIEYSLDIIERKKAEEKLRESESKYRSLFDNMLDGFAYCKILLDENSRPTDFVYLEINDAFERLTGLRKENVVGKKATEAIPGIKDSHPELFDIYGKVALTGKETKFDIYFEPLGIWLSISVYSPKKGYFVAIFDNITERKRAEEALARSENLLSSIIDQSPFSTWIADADGTNIRQNAACRKLFGIDRDEQTVGKYNIFRDSVLKAQGYMGEIQKVFNEGKAARFIIDYDFSKVRHVDVPDGTHKLIDATIFPIKDPNGKVINVVLQHEDITDREKTQRALRESEERYALAQQAARIGTWDWDIVANRMKCSSEMLRIWDVNGEDYTRREDFANLYHPDDKNRIAKAVEDALSGRKLYNTEYRIITPTGTVKWLHVQGKVFIDRDGKPVRMLGITQDITRRKKAEKKIRDYQERLRSLVSELTLVEEQQKRNLATELHDSIGQLLALCRIKLGELEKVTKATDVRSLAEEVEKGLEEIIWHTRSLTLRLGPPLLYELGLEVALEWLVEYMEEQYGIQTKFRVDGKVDPIQEELRVFLFRAVQELMMNVARHGETDKAEVSVWRENRTMHITVKDRGVGFNSAILDAPSGKDSGFGLFSIRERIKYFGGEASVQSKPGKGTQVTLVVPLKALRRRKGDK